MATTPLQDAQNQLAQAQAQAAACLANFRQAQSVLDLAQARYNTNIAKFNDDVATAQSLVTSLGG